MTFAQRRNRLTTHFSEGVPVFNDAYNYISGGGGLFLSPVLLIVRKLNFIAIIFC